jgi:addiction module HigA family antidote
MMRNPAHPGEIIQEYMEGLGLSVSALAVHLKVTRANLSRILHGKAGVSAEMALRLAAAFGTTPEIWVRLQANYELAQALRKPRTKITRLAA